jgi:hypothetical protein
MLQEFCRRVGIPPSDSGIEQLLGVLKALPSGHPLTPLLRDARDFGTPAALADALLNPQDRAYSVPQLFGLLQTAGLVFGRWLRQAPYSAQCGVLAAIATTTGLGQLPPAEQFAAAELFRGTMLRHSAIVYRDDAPHPSPPISFGDEKWLAHVPLRLADALCDRERLPAGAVAVLRSRAHAYADTCLPLNARQLRMLEAIDGTRTVAEVLGAQAHSNEARAWFERLWWHDQIVFDASRVP